MITINGPRLLDDLRALAAFGRYETGVDRVAFSPADLAARRWLTERFAAAGLKAHLDGFGTVYGTMPEVGKTLLIGSHSDTVPKGGWLDGSLGVIYALEIARAFREAGLSQRGIGIDVVSFQDEEGTYLACLGSRAFCGDLDAAAIAAARGKDGRPLTEAMAAGKLAGEPVRRDPARHLAFLEAHIEQGPRLEAAGRSIGVVEAIVGIRRLWLQSAGQADHAGTTPMPMRRDAGEPLLRFAAWVLHRFAAVAGPQTVWNIGSLALEPGAANVVPARGSLSFEFRDPDAARLDALEAEVLAAIADIRQGCRARLDAAVTTRIAPVAMDARIVGALAAAARELGHDPLMLASGAGHDAMILARHMPSGMLFVPSIGGRSHDVSEDTREEDIVAGCAVLARTAARLAQELADG
jgi:N-carbamoyl-L-amino-acid hydrolase